MTYVGEHKERLRDGHGSYTFPRGLFAYDGQWRKGEMHGRGVFSIASFSASNGAGVSYEGEFENGEIEGIGLKRWPNGDSYSGQFHRGEMHGEGVFISHTGEKYEGQWRDNQRYGTGELVFANGDMYTGEFASHKPHGHGRIALADSRHVFGGEWVNGVITGQGVLSDREGNKLYEGAWVDGQRDGRGFGAVVDGGESGAVGMNTVWYTGLWTRNRPVERTTRLAVKIVGTPAASNARPTSALAAPPDAQPQRGEKDGNDEDDEDLLSLVDLPSTVSVDQSKTLPHFVVVSVSDDREASAADTATDSVVVRGESCRQIRFRVFEGQCDEGAASTAPSAAATVSSPPPASDEQASDEAAGTSNNATAKQWQFVLERDDNFKAAADGAQQQESVQDIATAAASEEGKEREAAAQPKEREAEEERLDEVVAENAKGSAHFQRLALPTTTLPGSYYILCESLASSDVLPPVVINLFVV